MITWQDDGIIITTKKHGERHVIVSLLTPHHGRHKGICSMSAKARSTLHPGAVVQATWQSRLVDHLGSYRLESKTSILAHILQNPVALSGLTAACMLMESCLPEREKAAEVYEAFQAFLEALAEGNALAWLQAYCFLELALLQHAGLRLDLTRCAATGATEDLVYVSPRSGRAVSQAAGLPYHEKMLPLPPFLKDISPDSRGTPDMQEILAALRLSGYFLTTYVFEPHDMEEPRGRQQFISTLIKKSS